VTISGASAAAAGGCEAANTAGAPKSRQIKANPASPIIFLKLFLCSFVIVTLLYIFFVLRR
jgi:hypothetical protein